jgi:hypothetical protein
MGRAYCNQQNDNAGQSAAQSALEAALRAWDQSVSELWRTWLALTQAQKRVTRAHELLHNALRAMDKQQS